MWCIDTHKNCKKPIPAFTAVSKTLTNLGVKFGRMDLEDYSDIGKEVGLDRLPYVRFYPAGAKTNDTAINME